LGPPEAEEGPMKTVWIYVDTNKQVGDVDHLNGTLTTRRLRGEGSLYVDLSKTEFSSVGGGCEPNVSFTTTFS
jgi:hypothetical protein